MDELSAGEAIWWRSPRLIAAAACFLLGTVVLVAGLVPRLAPAAPVAAQPVAGELLADDFMVKGDDLAALEPTEPDDQGQDLVVYVSGAVVAPDVYRLPAGARVKDAVVAAGGLRADAAGELVNLAEPVSDAQHIHVPALGGDGAGEEVQQMAGEAADDELIDLNRASAAELEELPGVGKVLAERIVARRDEQGPYTSVDELREVTGVGAKLFDQIAPLVSASQ